MFDYFGLIDWASWNYLDCEVDWISGTVKFTTKTLRGGPIPNHHRDMNESEFAYEVVVGLPSEKFRQIINHFYQPGLPFGNYLFPIERFSELFL